MPSRFGLLVSLFHIANSRSRDDPRRPPARLQQAACAAHAGVSVIQPSVGRLEAHFKRRAHPTSRLTHRSSHIALRSHAAAALPATAAHPEASGPFSLPGKSPHEAGLDLVAATMAYCRRHKLRSKIMAAARSAEECVHVWMSLRPSFVA